jgi:hypothetical protein
LKDNRSLVARLIRLSLPQCLLLIEAFGLLAVAKLLARSIPFRFLAKQLDTPNPVAASTTGAWSKSEIRKVSWAVQAIARQAPPFRQCLLQAIAARWMLKRRRILNTLFLGVRKSGAGPMLAHAWLNAAGQTVVGKFEKEDYRVIAVFGDHCENGRLHAA